MREYKDSWGGGNEEKRSTRISTREIKKNKKIVIFKMGWNRCLKNKKKSGQKFDDVSVKWWSRAYRFLIFLLLFFRRLLPVEVAMFPAPVVSGSLLSAAFSFSLSTSSGIQPGVTTETIWWKEKFSVKNWNPHYSCYYTPSTNLPISLWLIMTLLIVNNEFGEMTTLWWARRLLAYICLRFWIIIIVIIIIIIIINY